jgi:hypothetical protein
VLIETNNVERIRVNRLFISGRLSGSLEMPTLITAGGVNECLRRWIECCVASEQAQRQEMERVAKQTLRERLTPLEERLSRLLPTIPVEIQREGLSLSVLQASLRGRWRGLCHPGELGAALRKLGFTRQRRWADDAGFCALWFPAQ